MDTPAYEYATGIATHDAALLMLEHFPMPEQIFERIRFLQDLGFPENRAREIEHHYWPATRGGAVAPIAPPKQTPPWPRRAPPASPWSRLFGRLRALF